MAELKLKAKVRELPDKPGVYIMRDRLGRVIYVGKARSLRKRVSQYFHPSRRMAWDPKIRALVDSIADFEVHVVGSEPEALLLEGKLIKEYKPRYNAMFKDDKRFLMVKVNLNEEYPRFKFARLKKNDGAQYFGPFAHAGAVRRVMQFARKKYGVLIAGSAPIKSDDLKYSTYLVPVPLAEMSHDEYRQRVLKACAFLEGRSQEDIVALEEQMREAARQRQFEKAAELRDLIRSLQELSRSTRQRKFARDLSPKIDHVAEMTELQAVLGLPAAPSHIEGFDISNISGTLSVASAVCFQNGKPHKDHYRHYQIKTVEGADDFASMAEVVSRRYARIKAEGGTLPDLVMVDGGKGQLASACEALEKLGLSDLPVIGLAKQYEEIFVPDRMESIRLPANSPGLHLIQRLRDEAHRFANAYHQTLRRRVIQESVLDEFSGLGEKRKRALLRRFGSIARLRRATVDEMAETPGIGPSTAVDLRKFLDAAF
jgi:excinuclease ABC subunit C